MRFSCDCEHGVRPQLTLLSLTTFPFLALFSTFFSCWSSTASALCIPFSSLIRFCRDRGLPLLFFLVIPAPCCVPSASGREGVSSGAFMDLRDLSRSIPGEVSLLAARECIETAADSLLSYCNHTSLDLSCTHVCFSLTWKSSPS